MSAKREVVYNALTSQNIYQMTDVVSAACRSSNTPCTLHIYSMVTCSSAYATWVRVPLQQRGSCLQP